MADTHPAKPVDDRALREALMDALVRGNGMNDFLERFLELIGSAFGATRLVLYDYHEWERRFDLLYFRGYANAARSELHRLLVELDMKRALESRSPYQPAGMPNRWLLPLYFQEILEAVLMIEYAEPAPQLFPDAEAAAAAVSRFVGLFMSSSRLPVNQRAESGLSDLTRAREIQMSFLPSNHRVEERYEIFGFNESAALVGGDYFDYFCRQQDSVQCVVADACGHGLAAALIMTNFHGMLHAEAGRLAEFDSLFTSLNRRLHSSGEMVQYLTSVLFDYDQKTGAIRYFNAGHFDPLVLHSDGRATNLPGGGPPLGMFRNSTYESRSCPVGPGDMIVLFTDGLVELRNPQDEFFGVERILAATRDSRRLPLRDVAREVLAEASRFSQSTEPDDDITLFLVRLR